MDLVADQDQLLHTQDLGEYMQSLLFDFSCRAIKFLAAVFTLRHFDNRLFFFGVLVNSWVGAVRIHVHLWQ